jgi:hypothetical protein
MKNKKIGARLSPKRKMYADFGGVVYNEHFLWRLVACNPW